MDLEAKLKQAEEEASFSGGARKRDPKTAGGCYAIRSAALV
jgi:hypothetical protein